MEIERAWGRPPGWMAQQSRETRIALYAWARVRWQKEGDNAET